jgi:hypothetical protein
MAGFKLVTAGQHGEIHIELEEAFRPEIVLSRNPYLTCVEASDVNAPLSIRDAN